MPEPSLFDTAWDGWGSWWNPKEVPAGASYDPESLGLARQSAIGSLGGKILALAQAGLQPAQRATLLAGIAPGDDYQKSLAESATARLHSATAKRTEGELASEAASNALLDNLIAGKSGAGGRVGGGGALPGAGAGAVGDHIKTALAALAPAESGGNAGAQNAQGYSGQFQMGSALASDAGVYRPAPGERVADEKGRATNTWGGQWTIPGFEPMSHEQFRSNPAAQRAAAEQAMAHNWRQIQGAGLDRYVGSNIGGVEVTPAGLLQGMWLGGLRGLQTWVSGGGDPADSNKTTVSKWASLKPPGGATMTDASGSTYPGDPSAPGGAPFQPPVKPRSLADLTPDQLTLLRAMPAKDRPAKILEMTSKAESPTLLSPAQSAHLGPGTWQWSPTTGYSRIAEGKTADLTPAQNVAMGLAPDAITQRKADGTLNIVDPGKTKWADDDYLKRYRLNPDAKVTVKPDGTPNVLDKGTDPDAPLNPEAARGFLTRYAPQVRAGTLDANSPEGQRYQAAHDLISQQGARWVPIEQPDGTKHDVFQPGPNNFPRLGAAGSGPASVQTAPPVADRARTPQQLFADASQVRSETEKGPTFINYNNARPSMLILRQAEPIGNGASDRAMVIAYAKLLDPNSVVMTSEGEAIMKTGGIFDTLKGYISHISGGGILSPTVRRNLVENGESVYSAHENAWRDRVDTYRDLAKRGGLDPDTVLPSVKPISRYTPPGSKPNLPEWAKNEDDFVSGLVAHAKKGEGTMAEVEQIMKRYHIPQSVLQRLNK